MDLIGRIVRILSGSDKGRLMVVVGVDDDGMLLLANGRQRKLETPKRKKQKHAALLSAPRLQAGRMLTNRQIRQALRCFEGFPATEKG